MRKTVFALLSVIGFGILSSCQKSSPLPILQSEKNSLNVSDESKPPGGSVKWGILLNNGWCLIMDNGNLNCIVLEEVIIRPKIMMGLMQLEKASPPEVSSFFKSSEVRECFSAMDSSIYSSLISGKYYGRVGEQETSKANFYFGPEYPVTKENLELAIQFKVSLLMKD